MKGKVSSWDSLKKTRECLYEIEKFGIVKLRGVTEGERLKAQQEATRPQFNKELKRDEDKLDIEEFGYRLVMCGWIEPAIPGENYTEKKSSLQNIGYAILVKIAAKINELSGVSREDVGAAKNFFGPA